MAYAGYFYGMNILIMNEVEWAAPREKERQLTESNEVIIGHHCKIASF